LDGGKAAALPLEKLTKWIKSHRTTSFSFFKRLGKMTERANITAGLIDKTAHRQKAYFKLAAWGYVVVGGVVLFLWNLLGEELATGSALAGQVQNAGWHFEWVFSCHLRLWLLCSWRSSDARRFYGG
jgi:hypothetical protein